jgi:autotransporter-associated beta strand protein
MSKNTPKIIRHVVGGLLFAASSKLLAAEISKLNNSDSLDLPTSWNVGIVPGVADFAVFDEEVLGGSTSQTLSAAFSVGGLRFTDTVPATVSNGSVTFSGSFALTTGAGGIDLSQSSQNVDSFSNAGLLADTGQNWTVPSGRILYYQAGTTIARGARATLNMATESAKVSATYSQADTVLTVSSTAHGLAVGSSVRLVFSSPATATSGTFYVTNVPDANSFTVTKVNSLTESGTVDYWPSGAVRAENFTTTGARLGAYATYNKFDWAYFSFLENQWFQFTDSVGAGVTYAQNPSDNGVGTAAVTLDTGNFASGPFASPVDIVNSNGFATATAFRLNGWSSGGVHSGIRFNTPYATPGTPWRLDMSANGSSATTSARVYLANGPFSILVTPNVGAGNVEINGGSNGNCFRYDAAASELIVHQHNTQGDLIINAGLSQSGKSPNSHFTKTGAGKLIMDNPGFVGNGTVSIQEGRVEVGRDNARGTLNNRPIVNSGTVAFKRTDVVTYTGVISGTGTLESAMAGATGELILSGANTYTGPTVLTSGRLTLNNASSIGTGGPVTLGGGTLRYGTGISADISSGRTVTVSGNVTIDTNSNNVTYSGSFGNDGAGSLTKAASAGVLTLAGANTYTGGTTVNGGTLAVTNTSGSATGAGPLVVSSGAILTGTGTIAGTTTMSAGSTLDVAGAGVGTLTVGGLNLASGSLLTLDASGSANDKIVVTQPSGVSLSGVAITLRGGWLNTAGTYTIIEGSGTVGGTGLSALSVVNPAAGYSYDFANNAGVISLTTTLSGLISQWTSTGGGTWGTGSNWGAAVPSAQGDTASFTTQLSAPSTVTLPGSLTLGGVVFNSTNGYTISGQPGEVLTLSNGTQPSALNALSGHHTITTPAVLSSTVASDIAASSSITLSGAVSGPGGITKSGDGTLFLTGANSFSGLVQATDGFISFTDASGLGTGNLTLNGGGISFGGTNSVDLSTKAITIGVDGGIIDTNGNNVTFAAPIGNGGSGSLTKSGLGTLTLAAGNTYGGATNVDGGTLVLTGANTLGGLNTIRSATLQVDGNAALGDASSGITFAAGTGNTATLRFSAPATLGATRTLSLSSGTAQIDTGANAVVVGGVVTGSSLLTKSGSGSLALNGIFESTGGATVDEGTLIVGSSLGSGTVTLNGTSTLNLGARNLGNALVVNGTNGLLSGDGGGVSALGAVTGAGTLNVAITGANVDLRGALTGFTGTIAITSATGNLRLNGTGGGEGVTLKLGTGSTSVRNGATALTFGALEGLAGSILGGTGGGATQDVTYTVGAKNLNTTFAGAINNGAGRTSLTKVGTGTLTLSGTSLATGLTTVNAGTLIVDGSLTASTIVPAAPATPVMVNTDATLGGAGSIGSATTIAVGATLQTDATGLKRGALTFANGLILQGTTQFDFKGTGYTKVSSTSTTADSLVYGGALKINFLSTLYTGTYPLFESGSAPAGSFTGGVTVTTTEVPAGISLVDNAGVLTGTIGGASLSFNPATGVLTIDGGAEQVLPSAPGGVTATAGNAQVALQWNASSAAANYRVKRSLIATGPYTVLTSSVVTTSYTDTGLTNGTTYYYVIDAQNEAGNSNESAEVSATPADAPVLTALEQWRLAQFGVSVDDGTVLAGDNEDFDGDGLVNLMEYALGTDPKVANASPVTVSRVGSNLVVTYPRVSPADAKLTYSVLGSSDLTTAFTAGAGTTNTVGSTSTYTDDVDVSVAGVRRFLRLSVTYTP